MRKRMRFSNSWAHELQLDERGFALLWQRVSKGGCFQGDVRKSLISDSLTPGVKTLFELVKNAHLSTPGRIKFYNVPSACKISSDSRQFELVFMFWVLMHACNCMLGKYILWINLQLFRPLCSLHTPRSGVFAPVEAHNLVHQARFLGTETLRWWLWFSRPRLPPSSLLLLCEIEYRSGTPLQGGSCCRIRRNGAIYGTTGP